MEAHVCACAWAWESRQVVVLDDSPPSMFLAEAMHDPAFAKRVAFIQGSPLLAKARRSGLID